MASTLAILLISALVLVQGRNTPGSDEDYSALQETSNWSRTPATNWPWEVARFPAAYILMHKVNKRLERIDNEDIKKRIQDYAVDQLRQCILGEEMDEHCVKRSIGYTMSFINHQKRQENMLQRYRL
ncbi:uncharacterized protein LOC108109422 [Drosophila eugracilis]|uniref:uncharacterized protein LOC108109422 n=1 Tax=Drosophila eugracilis TaxID=29029 RepID=UPI0007E808C4|nr:uncharacterized protein LOC108109422 [Drosophila eugracilis]